jgi:hypothetical protein
MYACYKIKNKQKEWHPATKPLKKEKKKRKKKIIKKNINQNNKFLVGNP